MTPIPDSGALRRQIYTVMIVLASGMALGRILSAELVFEPSIHREEKDPNDKRRKWPATRPAEMPTFSSNDRSRWCTVRALVDRGTFVIGERNPPPPEMKRQLGLIAGGASIFFTYQDSGIVFENGWQTVDKVLNPEKQESSQTQEFYSSKPPLLPVLMAGEYWVLKHGLGWEITQRPWSVVRVIVLTFNWLPWIGYLVLLALLVERFGTTDWGRLFVMAAGCFGTLLTPFLITMNNHTLAAFSALAAVYLAARIWDGAGRGLGEWRFAGAGFLSSFTVTNELPAAIFAAGLGLLLLWRWPRSTLLWFVPAACIPAAAFLFTNHMAIGEWTPAYDKFGTEWYEYEGSHWKRDPAKPKSGIDWAGDKETRLTYAANVLIGHHGLFSLTPFLLLAVAGMLQGSLLAMRWLTARRPATDAPDAQNAKSTPSSIAARPRTRLWAGFAAFSLLVTLVVGAFYLVITESANYGGWSCGPRWLIWMTPLWLLCALPVADRLSTWRGGRALACVLLALSVLSASYPAWNPWRHPWIYNFMDSQGWIPY